MLKTLLSGIVEFFRALFHHKPADTNRVRSAQQAQMVKVTALKTIDAVDSGNVPCPWCSVPRDGMQCGFSRVSKTYRCAKCFRDGNIATLITRLNTPGVYEFVVE